MGKRTIPAGSLFSGRYEKWSKKNRPSRTRYSTTKEFLSAVSPSFAVISCGKGNEYGHPHGRVLSLLKKQGVDLFRTDLQGTIRMDSDGKTVSFVTERTAEKEELFIASGWE